MTTKRYHQYCAIAAALDVVGERWSLLIIRNLLMGPKRFSDLMRGLPGISTNILTDRLKLLESQDVVSTRFLPPPAASTVYELTVNGLGLVDVLAALARWGSVSLESASDDPIIVPEGIAFMVLGVFQRTERLDADLTCNLRVYAQRFDQTYSIHFAPGGITMSEGGVPVPDVSLDIPLDRMPALSSRRVLLQTLIESRAVRIDGAERTIELLLQWVDGRLPTRPPG